MKTQQKVKDYINRSVRKLKNRKGYGVHSPFAFGIITEVIEEKLPYYAYQSMQRVYPSNGPIPFKVACLLHRLANRFKSRVILEVGCDGGYSLLPVGLSDSRNELYSVATSEAAEFAQKHLAWFKPVLNRTKFISNIADLPKDLKIDMLIVNGLPNRDHEAFCTWVLSHVSEEGVIFVKGIQPGRQHEDFWDCLCDYDEIHITMDMYDYGLAIRRPNFFKQHYIVSF